MVSKRRHNLFEESTGCFEVSVFLFGDAHTHYSVGAIGSQVCMNKGTMLATISFAFIDQSVP
jgi:hypothetical protein